MNDIYLLVESFEKRRGGFDVYFDFATEQDFASFKQLVPLDMSPYSETMVLFHCNENCSAKSAIKLRLLQGVYRKIKKEMLEKISHDFIVRDSYLVACEVTVSLEDFNNLLDSSDKAFRRNKY